MERENVLSLAAVQTLFNKFFRQGQKLFRDRLADWIVHPEAKKRLFGITRTAFSALAPKRADRNDRVTACCFAFFKGPPLAVRGIDRRVIVSVFGSQRLIFWACHGFPLPKDGLYQNR
jgi:hypothetical protein